MLAPDVAAKLRNANPAFDVYTRDAIGGLWPVGEVSVEPIDKLTDHMGVVITQEAMADAMRIRQAGEILARAWSNAADAQRGALAREAVAIEMGFGVLSIEEADRFLNLAQEIRAAVA